jgi:hypothetical protein
MAALRVAAAGVTMLRLPAAPDGGAAIAVPERSRFSIWHLDIPDTGKLEVGYYMDGRYWWRLHNRTGSLLHDGHSLTVAGEQSTRSAVTALLLFLLATADSPLRDFNHATTVWAALNREDLRRTLGRLIGGGER